MVPLCLYNEDTGISDNKYADNKARIIVTLISDNFAIKFGDNSNPDNSDGDTEKCGN